MNDRPSLGARGAILALLLCAALLPAPARAYLDPGSGSYLVQVAVAALLTAGVALKAFAGRIAAAFRKLTGREEPAGGEQPVAKEKSEG